MEQISQVLTYFTPVDKEEAKSKTFFEKLVFYADFFLLVVLIHVLMEQISQVLTYSISLLMIGRR
jgi:hypothetical protein